MGLSRKKSCAIEWSTGFSLIELLIVVAIILIIAAIAIPNLLRAKIASNEASAGHSIRSINTAELAYNSTYPTNGFAAALANLGGVAPCVPTAAAACLIDNVLATAIVGSAGKSGYVFAATGLVPNGATNLSFVSAASPLSYNQSGVRDFCSTEDGVIRFDAGAPASLPVNTLAACRAFSILE
jgi:type IV pilus assembly protein PilA